MFYFPLHLFILRIVSTFTKGEQMIPVLNEIGVHCAVLGNHDFGKIKTVFFCENKFVQFTEHKSVQCLFFSGSWP